MLAGAPPEQGAGAPAPGMGMLALAGSHLAMVPAGASQALYGPSMPEFAVRYGLSSSELGMVIAAHSFGTLLGIGGWVVAGSRPHPATVSGFGAALLGIGLLTVAFAVSWALTLVGAVIIGAGFGNTVVAVNMWSTRSYDRHRVTVLSTLAAAFGVGAVTGPTVVGAVGPGRFATGFAVFGALAVVAATALLATGVRGEFVPAVLSGRLQVAGSVPLIAAFMLVLALYVGMEAGIGGWLATHLVGLGVEPATAAGWTAGFWVAFTVGRAAGAPLAHRVSEHRLLPGLLAAAVLALLLAAVPVVAVGGYLLAGVAIALIFPTLLSWFTRVFGQPPVAVALLFASGSLGAGLLPPGIGVLIDRVGVSAAPLSLAAIAGTGCVLALVLGRVAPSRPTVTAW